MNLRGTLIAGAAALGLAACGGEESAPVENTPESPAVENTKATGKADAWDYRNDPARMAQFVNQELNYKLDELPKTGEATNKPWPASYWPTYMDSTNHRWRSADELSPMEKYDVAFNGWEVPAGFMDLRPFNPNRCEEGFDEEYYQKLGPAASWMSNYKGNKRSREFYGAEPTAEKCGEENPVESWWGLCHAWAPAANLEQEPIYPVTHNGVTFYPADIKALALTIYDGTNSMILGGRCNTKEVERDENGRIKDAACRDTNAGAMHVLLTNLIGVHGMSFQEDRTYNYEVWNQPILGFEITQMEEISEQQAIEALIAEPEGVTEYPYNDDAVKFVEVFATVKYITESHQEERALLPELGRYTRSDRYHYILELDADGKVLGGEWLQGRTNHSMWGISEQPDFLWATTGPSGRGNPHVSVENFRELLKLSRQAPGTGDNTEGEDASDAKVLSMAGDAIDIPDNDEAGISADVHIEETVTSAVVSVQVDIKHTYVGDLKVTLTDPNGGEHVLHDHAGGSQDDLSLNVNLDAFADANLQGKWTIHVSDTARIDTGKLMGFSIIAN